MKNGKRVAYRKNLKIMSLFQNRTKINSGTLEVVNMTNTTLSQSALDLIGEQCLENEEIGSVNVVCTSDEEDACFDVYDTTDAGTYIFSVTNSGILYSA